MGGYEPTNPWSRYTGVIILKQTEHGWHRWTAPHQIKWHGIATKSNISGEVKLLPILNLQIQYRSLILIRKQSDWLYRPKYYLDGDEYSSSYAGCQSERSCNTDYWVFDNYLTYTSKIRQIIAVTAMARYLRGERTLRRDSYAYKEGSGQQ